jgi:hypothetical protein
MDLIPSLSTSKTANNGGGANWEGEARVPLASSQHQPLHPKNKFWAEESGRIHCSRLDPEETHPEYVS